MRFKLLLSVSMLGCIAIALIVKPVRAELFKVVMNVDRLLRHRSYAIGEIKGSLSQSYYLCNTLASNFGADKILIPELIDCALRNDSSIIAIQIWDSGKELALGKDHVVFAENQAKSVGLEPLLFAKDDKCLDVYRFIYKDTNKVGTLAMRRKTLVQVTSNDVAEFLRFGDGGRIK